jgi:selenide, water dikinase
MAELARPTDPALLVGTETSDDAGVYQLSETQAIVCTADFITPVLDDPYLFGQIAAANALSDVYAMGGRPVTALALCMFPKALQPEVAQKILAGGQAKVNEAGAQIVGGHTVRADELLYGLAVTGVVHPRAIVRNIGAQPGDGLILTKPLGSGLIINGLRKGAIDEGRARPILEKLAVLNRRAAEVMGRFASAVHAATDVTGFGLVGHALNMARGSGVALRIELAALPRYPAVEEMVQKGVTTGSTKPNRLNGAGFIQSTQPLPGFWDELVHDPQTSGGLLIAIDPEQVEHFLGALASAGVSDARRIGQVCAATSPHLEFHGE